MGWARLLLVGLVAVVACEKVPLTNVNAGFALAEAAWFEEEETLFVFWRVDAEQGLGPESQIEVTWLTDDAETPWTAVSAIPPVHTHVPVDCGSKSICGSTSIHVAGRPVRAGVRLRYHRDGELVLNTNLSLHHVGIGPPHTNRSLVVYGVHDQTNTRVQWRARHQFPSIRNEEAQELGLRRLFRVLDPSHGAPNVAFDANPYGYGGLGACPGDLAPLGWTPVETTNRAAFAPETLPVAATASPVVCARSEVTDARGTFEAVAFARKNPEVAPAFPIIHSPIKTNTPIGFILRPCQREISGVHLSMQVQRLLLEGAPEICIDDWQSARFKQELVTRVRARIDLMRAEGNDMVLEFVLHQDAGDAFAKVIEEALEELLIVELMKSSPRVSGAFVFDSLVHKVSSEAIRRLVLWCPANVVGDDLEQIPSTAERTCPVQLDTPDIQVGPVRFTSLPILSTRKQYLTFVERYSESQAGRSTAVQYRAPEMTPVTEHVPVGEFGVATFFNNETITASPTEAFSFCAETEGAQNAVFRVDAAPDPMPLAALPEVHASAPQPAYELGLVWDFPYLMRLQYEVVVAGAATAVGLTIPFGVALPAEAYYGTPLWQTGDFDLRDVLLRCARFCEHPTFDSAGVYNVLQPFRSTYASLCYRPRYPVLVDGGFPRDP